MLYTDHILLQTNDLTTNWRPLTSLAGADLYSVLVTQSWLVKLMRQRSMTPSHQKMIVDVKYIMKCKHVHFSKYIISLVFHNQENLIMERGHIILTIKKIAQLVTSPMFSPQSENPFHPFHYIQGQGHI